MAFIRRIASILGVGAPLRRGRHLLAAALAVTLLLAGLVLWPEAPARRTGSWMAAAGLSPRFEVIEGLRVRYVRAGTGPPVVLIHGLASSLYTWKDVLPPLACDHEVVAVDLPGFGGSDQPAVLSAEAYPAVVRGLMDRLAIARATVVGHSLGGAVAVMLAAGNPERVERLALVAPAGFNLARSELPWLLRAAAWPPLGALLERIPARRALLRLGLTQVFFDDTLVTDERVEEYWAPLARPGAVRALRALIGSREGLALRFPALAKQVHASTLLIWGRQDAWIPVAQAEHFLAAIGGSRAVVLDACGHMPQEEHPEEVVRLLLGLPD